MKLKSSRWIIRAFLYFLSMSQQPAAAQIENWMETNAHHFVQMNKDLSFAEIKQNHTLWVGELRVALKSQQLPKSAKKEIAQYLNYADSIEIELKNRADCKATHENIIAFDESMADEQEGQLSPKISRLGQVGLMVLATICKSGS